ncbi:putative glycosyl transferase [Planctomycetes bacterium MalM25]|nr:putative glycosyl transferase [Planctomycetes bacterium MalM25]
MKILAVYRHYWPDTTPYATLLRMILERLVEDGHSVTAFAGQPSYNGSTAAKRPWHETLSGIDIRRVALLPERKKQRLARGINVLIFLARAVVHSVLVRRYDLIVANAHPPIAIGVALRIIRWLTGAKYILHLQDIHPESLAEISASKKGSLYRLLRRIDSGSCGNADRLVTLSSDMKESLRERQTDLPPVSLINNCPQRTYADEAHPQAIHLGSADKTKLLFAGNLGRFQRLGSLVDAVKYVNHHDKLCMTMMGTGFLAEQLKQRADPNCVQLVDRQSLAVAHAAMRQADYGIVSLEPGVIKYAYPSKTMAYLSEGLPLLLIVEDDSELARLVRKEGLGVVAESSEPSGIGRAIDEAIERRDEWTIERRRQIARFCEHRFGAERMLQAWSDLISDLDASAATQAHSTKAAA